MACQADTLADDVRAAAWMRGLLGRSVGVTGPLAATAGAVGRLAEHAATLPMPAGVRGRIGILTVEPSVSLGTTAFMREISARGGMPVILNSLDTTMVATHDAVELAINGTSPGFLSAVIGRGGAHITEQGLSILNALDAGLAAGQGSVPIINGQSGLMIARSKSLTREALQAASIPHPGPSVRVPLGSNWHSAFNEALDVVEGPLVIKASRDMGGQGIAFVHEADRGQALLEAIRLADSGRGGELVVQPWRLEASGRDIGVYVVRSPEGELTPRAAIMRVAPEGKAASNTHAGGVPHGLKLDDTVEWDLRAADGTVEDTVPVRIADVAELAVRATEATGLDAARPDVIMTRSGLEVLEVNGSFGWSDRIQRITQSNVPGNVVDLAVHRAQQAGRWVE